MISTSDARQWIPPSVCAVVSKRSSLESRAPYGPPHNIPVRRGLEEGYSLHVNVANDDVTQAE